MIVENIDVRKLYNSEIKNHDHEFDQIVALENLDNYVESVFKRIRNRAFRTELIFGSMINLTSNSEKDTKMIRKHKVKAWGQYLTRSRLKVLPPYYGYEITPYMMVTEEIGYQMGIRRLKDLKIYKKIKMHKRRLEKLPNLQCEISKRWVHLANKITITALYKIILLYHIFTPFDSEAIENLKVNYLECAKNLYSAWEVIIRTEYPANFILDYQAKFPNKNPFLKQIFIKRFSSMINARSNKKLLEYGSNYILKFWLTHYYPEKFEFLPWDGKSKSSQGFFTFLNDCTISDFIESYPK
ncbi:hypothetical protein BY996DRAFT_7234224 [Phakopsora pachyrhizi]|nr:hypothetical protein BY996DRAFT_7234224 [Phakopsora pachyrhizi]